eukprot:SAG31_NODE_2507_length_5590_cov_2.037880_6_plen_119_part_00
MNSVIPMPILFRDSDYVHSRCTISILVIGIRTLFPFMALLGIPIVEFCPLEPLVIDLNRIGLGGGGGGGSLLAFLPICPFFPFFFFLALSQFTARDVNCETKTRRNIELGESKRYGSS